MEKIPTAKLFRETKLMDSSKPYTEEEIMIEFTKLHVEAALKAASENAKITERKKVIDNTGGYIRIPTIYKKHILNSYPLEKIK
jgi:hypothetical protein